MKILLAEDTQDLNRVITAMLTHEGYEVDSALDGAQALDYLEKDSYDAAILDIMMPKVSGIEVLQQMRKVHNVTPVLMLTAKAEVDDRVAGLDAGADDYLTKPFAMKELLARLRAMTRRRNEYSGEDLSFGDLTLSADSFELSSENSVRLSVKEFELLQCLILHAGKPLSTAFLLEHVWENAEGANGDTVWLYISYLRSKLTAIASQVTIEGTRGGSFTLLGGERHE
ncbi:MAG: response regulator transcription factor [Lachnospiraceae bacterium]|jgi:DNA-binding response OmpR family regulator|nr:response regulator transcription factor [Lachnospiraceae bacterium]MCI1423514.1 response regulator transcription factor [Lachnospiraceae bacterium]MCI1453393.1 response regulator transcription factor [Lachnospiraceae bacterium]MDD5849459.1 response regulator transcription factor [Bacillota bacterium]